MEELYIPIQDDLVETYNYRGISLPVYIDKALSVYYTIIAGKPAKIGNTDQSYRRQIENLVDKQLDWIADVDSDSYLEWFDNGGHQDIRLKSHGRIIKVILVKDDREVTDQTVQNLVELSKLILEEISV